MNNLETLETSGKQDTEVRQRKHNRQSRDTGNIRNTRNRHKTNKASQTPPKSGGLQSTDTGTIGHKTQKVEKQNKKHNTEN